MFGYKLIKEVEIENLKLELAGANKIIGEQTKRIVELESKVKEQDTIIANLTETKTVTIETKVTDDKPVKKVRRKSSKKTTKKEE